MFKLSFENLAKIALGVTIAGTGTLYVTRWAIQGKLRESVSYKEALQYLRSNENALSLLGEPVHEKRIDIGDKNCYGQKDNVCWVSVPIEGQKYSGYLNYWVTVTDREKKKFHVSRVELDVFGSGKKILLMNNSTKTQEDDEFAAA